MIGPSHHTGWAIIMGALLTGTPLNSAASPVPIPRPMISVAHDKVSPLPAPRPSFLDQPAEIAADPSLGPVTASPPLPRARPAVQAPSDPPLRTDALPLASATASEGMVCRDPRLVGRPKPDIISPNRPCGVLDPVEISAIAGVALSTPATLNCPTARRVADWLTGIAQPAAQEKLGQSITEIWVMGSYVCRTRNHRPGARISEHGKGRAIDIGGMTLTDGRKVTVRQDWNRGAAGRFLATTHAQACGLFHTVLGPKSDALHRDHFHFDTAQRGGRPYCR